MVSFDQTDDDSTGFQLKSQYVGDMKLLKIKVGEKIILDSAYFDLDMPVNLLVGLTLLKLGIVGGLAEMDEV